MNPLLTENNIPQTFSARMNSLVSAVKMLALLVMLTMMRAGRWRLLKRRTQRDLQQGETIWLDDLEPSGDLPLAQQKNAARGDAGDMTPNQTIRPRKSRIMKIDTYPEPDYPFAYRNPPLSGNTINGFGETEPRPANKVFHSNSYKIAWRGLERYYHTRVNDVSFNMLRKIRWLDRDKDGHAMPAQYTVENPEEMADHVKEAAKQFGAELVGITALAREHTFEHFDRGPYHTAICIGISMDLDGMVYATSNKASAAVMDGYRRAATASVELAKRIRALGWEALAASNVGADTDEVLHIPLAVQAGLGQLGKHGSLISKELGSNLRLATVLTNMPLSHDEPADIGVDDFCTVCQVCLTNCPPQAIFETKQMVRGEEKWYVDFDKCVPYFAMNNSCGICVAVCPWTAPGRGETISLKMLAQRDEA
ncbi:MAG: reductive dehalogenase domain-containing protein [Chloroflexota bacterium]